MKNKKKNMPVADTKIKMMHFTTCDGKRVCMALTTFAGKTVKAKAVCLPTDEYNEEFGDAVAVARLKIRLWQLRAEKASKRIASAYQELAIANSHVSTSTVSLMEAQKEQIETEKFLEALLNV